MPEAAKASGNLHVHPRHAGVGIAGNRADNDNAARFHYLTGWVRYARKTRMVLTRESYSLEADVV